MYDNIMSFVDGTQTVVLRRPGSDFETKISKALPRLFRSRRHYRVQESILPTNSVHWYFSRQETTEKPIPGDEIEDREGHCWTILEVNHSELNETWQCVARRYSVSFGLDEHVDHLRSAYAKTSSGVLEPGFRVLKSGIAARFTASVERFDSSRQKTLCALIRESIQAECRDMLRRADGTIFKIEKIQYPLYKNGWTEIMLSRTD